jgi:hypothetical protein
MCKRKDLGQLPVLPLIPKNPKKYLTVHIKDIICDNSSRGVVYFIENQIKVTSYLCRKSDTTLNIVVLLGHAPRSLKFFLPQEYSPKYFGIKNGKLKTYTEANLQKILKNYLL